MNAFFRRTWAEIDLDHLAHNWRVIRETLRPQTQMMAVVKADAYGHGAIPVSKTLRQNGATFFGVSNLEEAMQLRQAGVDDPILILSYTPPAEAEKLARFRLTQTVVSADHAAALSAAAVSAGVTVSVHLKIDTGMSRVGFVHQRPDDRPTAAREAAKAARLPGLDAQGIFTHFSSADERDETVTRAQFTRFMQTVDDLAAAGVRFSLRHCCNSAATMRFADMQLDMVRPGIILYGLAPDAGWMGNLMPLRPVMQLKTTVSMVKTLPAGASVSYNRTHTTKEPTAIATVPIGYADGYPRIMSNRAHMLVHGRPAPVIGRVCMDQCMLDVSGMDVQAGNTVTVFGEGLPVHQYAGWMDTVHYEAVCLVGKRVPRVYRQGGQPIGYENMILR